MKLTVKDIQGRDQGEVEINIALIDNGKGGAAVHQTVVAFNAAQRMGTACTKNAGEVAGTNKKPWRQKGTGRARAGSFQSPLWRGGGVVFGPRPRDFSNKVNRSTRQLALRKALGERIKAGDVLIVDNLELPSPKTRDFLVVLSALKVEGTALIVAHGAGPNLQLASRNVSRVELATGESLNTYQVLRSEKLVFTRSALQQVEQRLAKA